MRTKNSQDLTFMPIIDWLDKIISENLKYLPKLVYKFAKSVIETSSKVGEPSTYDEVINNLVNWSK